MQSNDDGILKTDDEDEATAAIRKSVMSIPPDRSESIIPKDKAVPLNIDFTPFNHFTAVAPADTDGIYQSFDFSPEVKKKPSFLETATAEAKEANSAYHYLHAGFTQLEKPWNVPPEENFNPKDYEDQMVNMDPKYYSAILGTKSKQELDSVLKRVNEEQKNNDDIKNGGWIGYLSGLGVGFATDPTSYIPIIGAVKYAKFGKTFLASAARALPGSAAYGAISAGGEQLDKVNGNLQSFLTDAVTRTVMSTVLFGGVGTADLSIDKMALWGMKGFLTDEIEGVGYKLKVDKNEKVTGMEAYDMTGGSLSADRVKIAQDKADSTFSKTGLFKIPYVGTAAEKVLSNPWYGSSILRMLNSPYKTERVVADLAVDHGIITEGLEKGNPNPDKFFTLMKQTHANIRAQEGQLNAMWMERNGLDLNNYVGQKFAQAGMYTRDKALELMGKNIGDKPYIDREQFLGEVEEALYTTNKSPHNAVNEASNMIRTQMDKSYSAWREAYNLPKDWLPPRTAEGYLMRVYDTQFLNNNEALWIREISNYLREADQTIIEHTQPINDMEERIKRNIADQEKLIAQPNSTDAQKRKLTDDLLSFKAQKKALEENLQNAIRTDPKLQLHAQDWNALSANEANELTQITKKRDIAQKEVDERKKIISGIKSQASKRKAAAIKNKTIEIAKKNKRKSVTGELVLEQEEEKLAIVQKELDEELANLQELAASGKINRRFYHQAKDSNVYVFRSPSERLKLRRTYHEQEGYRADEEQAHEFREAHAKAYYDTIVHQTAEDTINQVMGKFTGNGAENHTKQRTLMIPDEILYKNKFMTKDLMAKVANYESWLARRTHLKNVYRNVTLDGGFESILRDLDEEFQQNRLQLNNRKEIVEKKLSDENITSAEKKKLQKKLEDVENELGKETNRFEKAKTSINFTYEKMAGISRLTKNQKAVQSGIKSLTVAMNLGFLPLTMVTDLSAIGLKHGVLPFLRDGIYPVIESLGGMLKTKNSEAFRNTAAALNLASQHLGSATAEKNLGMMTNPYLNMGKIPAALDKYAHFSSNLSLTNATDNMLQRITSSVAQSEVMRCMYAFKNGKLSARDRRWLNRYGLDPETHAERFINAFKKNGGGKTSLGGYQSNFYHWQDLESSNKFSDAVFRATHDTIISANALDTPFWMDSNGGMGIMGPIFKGFQGWAFGSLNRYVIPFMQKPDASQFVGVMVMLAAGALVSPSRRLARGEDAYPPNMTDEQWMYEVISDSAFFSYFMSVINDANVLTKGSLLGDLKNDKYRDRARTGLLGPAWSDMNSMADMFTALATGEMNENDAHKMARMIPPFNTAWTYGMSKALIDSFGLPKTRAIAHSQKG